MRKTKIPPMTQWLVFTDLDGTLLDHRSYRFDAALPALSELKRLGVPVIINSSKTPSEIAEISTRLQLDTPQIAENGSVIFYPDRKESKNLGADYFFICTELERLRQSGAFNFTGFNDWTAKQVTEVTGLGILAAQQAKQRFGSEPLIWEDTEEKLDLFRELLTQKALVLNKGGRFWHVMGRTDKVEAMQFISEEYAEKRGGKPFVVALGDSVNDKGMLSAADVAVIVKNPHGTPIALEEERRSHCRRVIRTDLPGTSGWNEAISMLLEEVNPDSER